eukprot:c25238_g2_i1 orf=565-1932(-)
MGESSLEVLSFQHSYTSTSQELLSEVHSCESSCTSTLRELPSEVHSCKSSCTSTLRELPSEVHSCKSSCTSISQELLSKGSEPFNCSICSKLVYKPIVQACGHIFCFWCTYQAMNIRRESHCLVCRRPFKYFPRVCELLHFALTKAVPEEYERRGQEIQRAEEQKQVFSPRFLESPRHTWSPRSLEAVAGFNSQMAILSMTPRSGNTAIRSNANAQAGNNDHSNALGCEEAAQNENLQRDTGCAKKDNSSMQSILTVEDFCCSFCNGLLYRPVVLNCGEVFCESCLKTSTSKVLRCPSCRAPHPAGSVLICLELHQYLESAFPTEYLKRNLLQSAEKTQSSVCNTADAGDCKREGRLHVGVGCDGCGMFPIEGDRYRCADCKEIIGFDLCGSCYNNGGSRLGRFNQEHQPNHHMEQVQSGLSHRVFNMQNSSILQRRQQQQIVSDLDDYINSFVG